MSDGNKDNVRDILKGDAYWRTKLKVARDLITAENINQILSENGISGEIGLLSIDIDGNDYWVWKAISVINPINVVAVYNYRFGKEGAYTIPYDPKFNRESTPYRTLFWAALKALTELGEEKGYKFIGTNKTGLNAFFIRQDWIDKSGLKAVIVYEAYRVGVFKDYVI